MLELSLRKRLGEFSLDAELTAPARGVLVLVGESGSGKTTLLRLVAGLVEPDAGRLAFDGRVLADPASHAFVPANERAIGWVPQDYALFPHLDARANVEFGLRASGVRGASARERADRALARLGVGDLATRRPRELSGGQQQRVALARALVLEPRILLLDEPLAALDLPTRRTIRAELRRLFEELQCLVIFVTHSPAEGLAFGERIAVLEGGRVTQVGDREELLRKPRTRYVADFIGTNLFPARVSFRDARGLTHLATAEGEIVASDVEHDGAVFAVVDPREITVSLEAPQGSAQNVFAGRVLELEPEPPHGERVRVVLATEPPLVAELTRAAVESLALREGREVIATFKASGVRVFE